MKYYVIVVLLAASVSCKKNHTIHVHKNLTIHGHDVKKPDVKLGLGNIFGYIVNEWPTIANTGILSAFTSISIPMLATLLIGLPVMGVLAQLGVYEFLGLEERRDDEEDFVVGNKLDSYDDVYYNQQPENLPQRDDHYNNQHDKPYDNYHEKQYDNHHDTHLIYGSDNPDDLEAQSGVNYGDLGSEDPYRHYYYSHHKLSKAG